MQAAGHNAYVCGREKERKGICLGRSVISVSVRRGTVPIMNKTVLLDIDFYLR